MAFLALPDAWEFARRCARSDGHGEGKSLNLSDASCSLTIRSLGTQEYIGGSNQYACTLGITSGMKYGLLKMGEHMPRDAMDAGIQSFVDYIEGPARECMSHFDGGQLMFNFLLGEQKTLMWNGHLGGYDGILKAIEPKPNVLIQACTGRANLNGRPFDGSAAQFATSISRWLGEPEKVIWCLHDYLPIKPCTVDVIPATKLMEEQTRSKVISLEQGESTIIFDG